MSNGKNKLKVISEKELGLEILMALAQCSKQMMKDHSVVGVRAVIKFNRVSDSKYTALIDTGSVKKFIVDSEI